MLSATTMDSGQFFSRRRSVAKASLWSVTLLRGLAALWVALSHGDGLWWRGLPDLFFGHAPQFLSTQPPLRIFSAILFGMGFLAVPLFFVISGFCIHMPQAGQTDRLDLRAFAVRRFLRIYPLYIFMVVVSMALSVFRFGWHGRANLTLENFLGHLVFWHYADGGVNAGMGISPLMWTLAVEVHFYVLYALSLPLLRRFGLGRCTLILLALDIAYRAAWYFFGLFDRGLPGLLYPARFGPVRFGEWLLGAWVAEIYVTGRLPRWSGPLKPAMLAGAGLLFVAFGAAACVALGLRSHSTDIPACVGFMLLLIGMLVWESQRDAPPANLFARLAAAVGDRSYSLYLVHLTVMASAMELWVRVRQIPDKDALAGSVEYLLVVLAGIGLSFLAVEVTYRAIEVPSHRLARRLARRLQTSRAAHDPPPPEPAVAPERS